MPTRPIKLDSARVLLVEGKDEVNFFEALIRHLGIPDVQIFDVNGKPHFPIYIRQIQLDPRFPDLEAIGLVRDADNDGAAALDSLCRTLDIVYPAHGLGHSDVTTHGSRKLGLFIMPDGDTGALEQLCKRSVLTTPEAACVESLFGCALAAGRQPPANAQEADKAWIAAYLALVTDRRALGLASQAGVWDFACDEFKAISDWVLAMFA